jgi:amino acid transporter
VFGHKQAITPNNAVEVPVRFFVGHGLEEAVTILIITSSLACGLALNNVCVRYVYALGREKIIPQFAGKVHPKHRTPYVAIAMQAFIMAAILAAFYLSNATPFDVYAWLGIPALAWLMGVQVVCSIATITYFYRHREVNFLTTLIAPLLAAAGLTFALYLLFHKLTFIAGVSNGFVTAIPWITLAIPIFGIGYAFWLRANRPQKYEVLGRMVNEGGLL